VRKLNEYEKKQKLKAERYKELALKTKQKSIDAYDSSNRAVAGIPFGQPILVGHHSEKSHRNALKRSWNAMGRCVELSEKAEYYEKKAKSIENNTTISSDDPEAIIKLKAKLEQLEEKRENIKETNKQRRKEKKDGFPRYVLSNLGQNINSVKKRIKLLESKKDDVTTSQKIGEIEIVDNVEDNRIQVFFPDIPNEDIRTKLKGNGFRWSRYNGCWQSYRKAWNMRTAKDCAEMYGK